MLSNPWWPLSWIDILHHWKIITWANFLNFCWCLFQKHESRAFSHKFPKPKDEGWILVLGEIENKEVIALKRIGYIRNRSKSQLAFYTPEKTGRIIYTLYMMSDAYLGLDQQLDIPMEILPASIESQVNTELEDLNFGDDNLMSEMT